MTQYSKELCNDCHKNAWVVYDAAPQDKLCVHCIHARRQKAVADLALAKTVPQDLEAVARRLRASR